MTKRARNQTTIWSAARMAANDSSEIAKRAATSDLRPSRSINHGSAGPMMRMPAPASDALRPISQVASSRFSSASEKNG